MRREYISDVSIFASELYNNKTEKVEGVWSAVVKVEDWYDNDEGSPWEKTISGEGSSIMEALQDLSNKTKF